MRSTGLAQLTAVFALSVAAGTAQAQTYDSNSAYYRHHHHRHYVRNEDSCRNARRSSANTGTAVGAVGGGLLGAAASHGRLGGTLIGAGAGALVGHEVGKHNVRC